MTYWDKIEEAESSAPLSGQVAALRERHAGGRTHADILYVGGFRRAGSDEARVDGPVAGAGRVAKEPLDDTLGEIKCERCKRAGHSIYQPAPRGMTAGATVSETVPRSGHTNSVTGWMVQLFLHIRDLLNHHTATCRRRRSLMTAWAMRSGRGSVAEAKLAKAVEVLEELWRLQRTWSHTHRKVTPLFFIREGPHHPRRTERTGRWPSTSRRMKSSPASQHISNPHAVQPR